VLLVLLILGAAPVEPEPAIDRLARAVVEQAARAVPESPVAVWIEAPTPALARAFASVLSGQLVSKRYSAVVLEAPNAGTAERTAREKDLRTLIRVSLSAENTRLVARGDVLHTWVNFWAGSAPTRPGPGAALAATVDADAQAMTLASAANPAVTPSTAPLKLTLGLLARLPSPPAAIGIGDLDGDKRPEIAVLTDDELLVFSVDGRLVARADLRLLPASARPTREPFGAISIQSGTISWISGKRAHGETVTVAAGATRVTGAIDELALDGVTVRGVPGLNAFAAEVGWFGKPLALPAPLTATTTRAGVTLFIFANGTGALTRGAPPSAIFSQAPSAALLADLDGDGTAELVSTSPRFFPEQDEVRVLAVAAVEAIAAHAGSLGEAAPIWSGPTPRGRVLTAAAADLDGDGAEEVVLGSWLADGTGELLIARRSAP
jgi:hypothetical protein